MLDKLVELKDQIEKDLKVATDPDDATYYLQALDAVETLIDFLS